MTHSERILDDLLVLRIQQGSRPAFEHLARRWQQRLWRHALWLTGREDVAGDVLQESWLAIAKGIGRLQEPSAFRSWAYTIVTRAHTNRLRRRGRETTASPAELETLSATPPQASEKNASAAVTELRRALRRLRSDLRALVSLRYTEELSVSELAQVFDIPVGTVKSRLHQARQELKRILDKVER